MSVLPASMAVEGLERVQVRLDARTATRVRPGDRPLN